jgi:hypothetical protein
VSESYIFSSLQHVPSVLLVLTASRPSAAHHKRFLDKVDETLKPFIADQGYDWEYSTEEANRDLWKINGMLPPMPETVAEKEWVEKNRAVEFEPEQGGLPKL